MERPVKCEICGEQMYYSGDDRCEPEVSITFTDTSIGHQTYKEYQYVHTRCARRVIDYIEFIKNGGCSGILEV